MDYVYILKDGPSEELRYSIRSVVKNMPEGNIWVIGGKPDWYVGNYVPVKQDGPKYENAWMNLMALCETKKISQDFVLMNDDFFVVKKVDSVPTYHGGLFVEKIALYNAIAPRSMYTKRLSKTAAKLQRMSEVLYPVDYELHTPMPMNKAKLYPILKNYGDCLWRSMYGNIYNVQGIHITDVKVYAADLMKIKSYDYKSWLYPYVSSDDDSFGKIYKDILRDMFPDKTKYEAY